MLSFHEIVIRLVFAGALGALIGVERDLRRRPAGIRTSMFVCMATAMFTILSGELSRAWGDTGSTRIASNIVQGIGFLGAGAILRDAAGVVGMTTAATIFVEAAIGMAVGGGFYGVAGAATGIVLFALVVLSWVADRFGLKSRNMMFRLTTSHTDNVAGEVQRSLAQMKITMQQFRVSMAGTNSLVEFEADVSHHQQEQIVEQFKRAGVVTEVVPMESRHA
ncbi:MAG TPA: MgtC/SapB family protein [Candidatus Acidoferrum sp.]|jgi:putative Mg2+ transporter-C (MgtC) family protein